MADDDWWLNPAFAAEISGADLFVDNDDVMLGHLHVADGREVEYAAETLDRYSAFLGSSASIIRLSFSKTSQPSAGAAVWDEASGIPAPNENRSPGCLTVDSEGGEDLPELFLPGQREAILLGGSLAPPLGDGNSTDDMEEMKPWWRVSRDASLCEELEGSPPKALPPGGFMSFAPRLPSGQPPVRGLRDQTYTLAAEMMRSAPGEDAVVLPLEAKLQPLARLSSTAESNSTEETVVSPPERPLRRVTTRPSRYDECVCDLDDEEWVEEEEEEEYEVEARKRRARRNSPAGSRRRLRSERLSKAALEREWADADHPPIETHPGVPPDYLNSKQICRAGERISPAQTATLKYWMAAPENWENPYPSRETKMELVRATGLTQQQVSDWLRNERKRIWLPLHPDFRAKRMWQQRIPRSRSAADDSNDSSDGPSSRVKRGRRGKRQSEDSE